MLVKKYEDDDGMYEKRITRDTAISSNFGGYSYKPIVAAVLSVLSVSGAAMAADIDTPTLGDDSAYTLERVDSAGENTITNYEYDASTGDLTTTYYQVNLKQKEYGSGDSVKYWGWTTDENGNKTFGEVGESEADVTFRYNTPASSLDRVESSGDSGSITLDDITGSFVGQTGVSGGAVSFINTNIDKITADFINNFATTKGGAIYHDNTVLTGGTGSIQAIIGDFIGNNVKNGSTSAVSGGAIYTTQDIGNINGDFVGNYVYTRNSDSASGGAIANRDTIGSIEGNFIGNYLDSAMGSYGGAISSNTGGIGSIKGDFLGNHAIAVTMLSSGGAIHNYSNIGSIEGNFIGNYASANAVASGGAIGNGKTIGSISGDFIGNYAESIDRSAQGGAIYNDNDIKSISGDFIGNYSLGSSNGAGGAIAQNAGNINEITGNFISNYAIGEYADGGAIYNIYDSIGNITGDFIGNYSKGSNVSSGGAISAEEGTIGDITGDFIHNYAITEGDVEFAIAEGGAIHLYDNFTGNITGNFIENHASGSYDGAGGAIWTSDYGEIGDITGDFVGNYASGNNYVEGGAIATGYTVGNIKGNFIGNYASAGQESIGGAIYNDNDIKSITGDFTGNYATAKEGSAVGGAIYNDNDGLIGKISGNFVENYVSANGNASGGAIYNRGNLDDFNFSDAEKVIRVVSNTIINADTGESYTTYNLNNTDTVIPVEEVQNKVLKEGYKIYIQDFGSQKLSDEEYQGILPEMEMNSDFTESPEILFGKEHIQKVDSSITNISFINNYAKSENGEAKGGAIYTTNDIVLAAKDGYTFEISGNYVEDINGKREEAIYSEDADVEFNAKTNGKFLLNDKINGTNNYLVNLTGDKTGTIQLNNNIEAEKPDGTRGSANVELSEVTLHLAQRDNVLDNNNLTLNSGMVNMINNQVGISALNSMTVKGNTSFVADVDLANKTMDRFTAENYGEHTGNVNVVGMNLLSDAKDDNTAIYFAQPGLKYNVTNGTGELPDSNQTTVYSPIYKYNVTYDNQNQYNGQGDGGYFLFSRGSTTGGGSSSGGGGGNPSDAFNPAVLSTSTSNLAASQAAMNEAFKYVFEHADAFTQLPANERYAKLNSNKYALSTDYNENMGRLTADLHNKGAWVRPYATFENMDLKHGPKVDAITYGTLVGFDTDFHEHKNGWHSVTTGYVGYTGSQLNYSGVDTTMNGGLLGVTQTYYKKNFWTALTLSAGASVGQSRNMYGKEDFTSLLAGIGSKTGYNFEFKDGKFIIQPIMFMSYTFVNTFDYRNAAGVKIEADPMHSIQLNPQVRFIANMKNGWQPYASVGMVWNILNETSVTANNVRLPEMSIKPYVEYGVGVQKCFKDKYTGFMQAMVRNGGRNGVALTAGFRWALGEEGKPIEKVETKPVDEMSYEELRNKKKDRMSSLVPQISRYETGTARLGLMHGE